MGDVEWLTPTLLRWEPQPCASHYNVYVVMTDRPLPDRDGDGVADTYGVCILPGQTMNEAELTQPPDPQKVAFYLITAENGVGEGGLGTAGSMQPRPNTNPCP